MQGESNWSTIKGVQDWKLRPKQALPLVHLPIKICLPHLYCRNWRQPKWCSTIWSLELAIIIGPKLKSYQIQLEMKSVIGWTTLSQSYMDASMEFPLNPSNLKELLKNKLNNSFDNSPQATTISSCQASRGSNYKGLTSTKQSYQSLTKTD